MAKMPMTRNPKTGKMVPSFAMDGKGAGDLKKLRGGGMMAKGYNIGGAIDEIKNKKTTKGMAKAEQLNLWLKVVLLKCVVVE